MDFPSAIWGGDKSPMTILEWCLVPQAWPPQWYTHYYHLYSEDKETEAWKSLWFTWYNQEVAEWDCSSGQAKFIFLPCDHNVLQHQFGREANVIWYWDLNMAINYAAQGTLDSQDKSCCSQHPLDTLLEEKEITYPLVPYPYIPVVTGGKAISVFLIPFDLWGTRCKAKSGEESCCPQRLRNRVELIQGSWIMSSRWIRTELFKLLWLHQLHNERENEAKKINELTHGNRMRDT